MPEIRECFIHFQYSQHVLVEKLGLGQTLEHNWSLLELFADATDEEAGKKSHQSSLGVQITMQEVILIELMDLVGVRATLPLMLLVS